MPEAAISLAARLRQRRAELGLSQAEAARELDVARTAYRLWEMEAAKPSPDRWRLIARWLGVSVSTMLVAEQLMTKEEAGSAPAAFAELEREERPAAQGGDFYGRADSALLESVRQGVISGADAEALGILLRRIELQAPATTPTAGWERAELRKALPLDADAPSIARAALQVTALGIPAAALSDATILVSELVSSAALDGDSAGDTIGLAIVVPRDKVRVDVTVRLDDGTQGFPLSDMTVKLLTAMATRWGTERERDGSVRCWFEVDLPLPGV